MAWIGVVLTALLNLVKNVFSMANPETTEVIDEKPDIPLDPNHDSDDALLHELGVRTESRPANQNRVCNTPCRTPDAGSGKLED